MGLMNLMVTITHNDSCPEMLAAVRRGLFSTPTDEEFVEYLLQRKPKQQKRPAFEDHSLDVALFIIVFLSTFFRRLFRCAGSAFCTWKLNCGRPKLLGKHQSTEEHVLSYQRRNVAFKNNFLIRNQVTRLGIPRDWFDRTEAQNRAVPRLVALARSVRN